MVATFLSLKYTIENLLASTFNVVFTYLHDGSHSIQVATTINMAATIPKLVVTFRSLKATIENLVASTLNVVSSYLPSGSHSI